jgi:hypothetical protein
VVNVGRVADRAARLGDHETLEVPDFDDGGEERSVKK